MSNLRQIRLVTKLTQLQTALRLGISLRQYQHIEKGTRRPSYDVLCKLEELFKLSHRDLLQQIDGKKDTKLL